MKLTPKNRQIETSDKFEQSSEFTIDPSSVDIILDFLRNKLYSDKPLAVIRETSCNAADGNIEIGKPDLPITVHIPTPSEAYFSVTDNGPGLDAQEIDETYTKFGKSTKRDTDEQVGGLGLGCKAPHAYTDSFTVESTKNGITNIFACYLSKQKARADLIDSRPSDKPTGTIVTVPVKQQDVRQFYNIAANFFQTFEPKPKFNVELPVDSSNENGSYFEKDDLSWTIQPNKSEITLIMGNVPYKVVTNSLPEQLKKETNIFIEINKSIYNSYVLNYNNYGCTIRIPIGSVDFTISREQLEYTDKTIAYLKNINKIIRDTALQQSLDKVAEAKDFYAAHIAKDNLNSLTSRYINKQDLTWKDYKIENYLLHNYIHGNNTNYTCELRTIRIRKGSNVKSIGYVPSGTRVLFVNNNKSTLWTKKVKYYLEQHPEYDYAVEVKFEDNANEFKDKYNLQLFDWVNTSELEKPPTSAVKGGVTSTFKTKKHSLHLFTFNPDGSRVKPRSNWWNIVEKGDEPEDTNENVYVVLDSFFYQNGEIKINPRSLKNTISGNSHITMPETIYGIKKNHTANYESKSNWILLDKYIERENNKFLTNPENIEKVAKIKLWEVLNDKERIVLDLIRNGTIDIDTKLTQKLKKLAEVTKDCKNIQLNSMITNHILSDKDTLEKINKNVAQYPNVTKAVQSSYGKDTWFMLSHILEKWRDPAMSYGYPKYPANPEKFAYFINLIDKDMYGQK